MMTGYLEYEQLIVARLAMEGVEVLPLPLAWKLNQPLPLNTSRVYVVFAGSTFEDTSHLGELAQDEQLVFQVIIQARTRDGDNGIFAMAEAITEKLLKWRVPDATRSITLNSFSYVDGMQNGWEYNLKFTFPRIRIKPEPESSDLLIREITLKDFLHVKSENI